MKVKIGEKCETNKDCINNNCVDKICTRRARKQNLNTKSVKVPRVKVPRVKVNNKKVKIGEKCQTNKNCINNNCVNGICTRKINIKNFNAKAKSIKVKTKKKITEDRINPEEQSPLFGVNTPKTLPKYISNIIHFYVIPDTEEMMKIHEDLSEIGINKHSFFYDPCYFLNNLQKILKAPKFIKFKKSAFLLLPIIYPKNKKFRVENYENKKRVDSIEFNKYIKKSVLGDKNLTISMDAKNKVGEGSYGTIYKSTIQDKDIVIKVPIKNNYEDDLDENIIQNELFCAMRGNWTTGARIPKIEYIARLYIPTSPRSRITQMKIITGMEKMEGNLLQFINNVLPKFKIDDVDKILKDMFIQVCELLIKLQDKYDFHHRDFHMGNIMYNNFGTKSNPKYKWYIIDFGLSYMNIGGRKYHAEAINMYRKYKSTNKSFDLRILFTNISELEMLTTDAHPECKSINLIISICKKLYRHYIYDLKIDLNEYATPWHASYYTFENKLETDKFTDPREFIKLIKKL